MTTTNRPLVHVDLVGLRQCPSCGVHFAAVPPARRSTAIYCTQGCRQRAYRHRRRGIPMVRRYNE